jgi:hypothetical protein
MLVILNADLPAERRNQLEAVPRKMSGRTRLSWLSQVY